MHYAGSYSKGPNFFGKDSPVNSVDLTLELQAASVAGGKQASSSS
jgi:hypothetical protein